MPRFNRVCAVSFGRGKELFLSVEGLRIAFTVDKTPYGEPNSCQVSIHNLTATTRAKIASAEKLYLYAGYADESDGERLVCAMDITAVQSTIDKPDSVTTIVGGDGTVALRDAKTSISFGPGARVSDVLKKLGAQFGIVLRDLGAVGDATYRNGFAEMGPLGDILDRVAAKLGAVWSFQNGELQFTPHRSPNGARVIVLGPRSGLVGSPKPSTKLGDPSAPADLVGWAVRSLLLPQLEPGARVRIESAEVKGDFRADKVVHTGDTHGQEWYTDIEVSAIE